MNTDELTKQVLDMNNRLIAIERTLSTFALAYTSKTQWKQLDHIRDSAIQSLTADVEAIKTQLRLMSVDASSGNLTFSITS